MTTITIDGVTYRDDPRRRYLLPGELPSSEGDDREPWQPADGPLPTVPLDTSAGPIPYDPAWWRDINARIAASPDIADDDSANV